MVDHEQTDIDSQTNLNKKYFPSLLERDKKRKKLKFSVKISIGFEFFKLLFLFL